jgi:predicted N-acetyltransferase YhbS
MPTIRTATPADAEGIAGVVNAAFEIERPLRTGGDRTSSQQVRDLMQRDAFFVAEHGGEIIGAVYVRIAGNTGYFGMLAVDESFRRTGVGRALREHAETYCRGRSCTRMTLTTGDFRIELPPYYERAGYRRIGTEPGPAEWRIGRPFKIIHMAKDL